MTLTILKNLSIALSITDKIDTLVGFFGINEKPTSSKDPFALRRIALGIIRTIIENKKDFRVNDLLVYSSSLYEDQGHSFTNQNLQKELYNFLKDRFKYYMKEKQIRLDIIDASISSFSCNKLFSSFEKAKSLNKIINNHVGLDITSSFKRASNILESEMKNVEFEITNTTDPGIFKTDFEKNLYKKINEIKITIQILTTMKIMNIHYPFWLEPRKRSSSFLIMLKLMKKMKL